MNYLLLFLAVAFGYALALFLKTKEMKQMSIYLAFSGAFLLAITIFELLPEVYESPSKHTGLFIMAGILLQIFLEFFSKGAEHGHVHLHSENKSFPSSRLLKNFVPPPAKKSILAEGKKVAISSYNRLDLECA